MLLILAHIHWAFEDWMPLSEYWIQLNTTWKLFELVWMPLSECLHPWTQLRAHECLWVSMNVPWIQKSAWMTRSEHEHHLNVIEACKCLWVSLKPLNMIESMWMPSSEDWRLLQSIKSTFGYCLSLLLFIIYVCYCRLSLWFYVD